MHLSGLLGHQLHSPSGEGVGKVDDVIVRLRGGDYPVVTGLVVKVGGRRVYVPINRVAELSEQQRISLAKAKVDLGGFERRDGEVLLREDILRHRLIDVADAALVRAWDVEFQATADGWILSCLDTRRPARFLGLIGRSAGHPCEDWKAFEPLIGHSESVRARAGFGRVVRLKPAQIADLLEDAVHGPEGEEILDVVHADPELEADVFEELDPDIANRLFGDKSDEEVADVIAHMRADDAADAIADLPQGRRLKVLDLLPWGTRTKVLTLLGFNATSAGGIMGVDFLTAPTNATVEEALRRIRLAQKVQPEALLTVHVVDDNRLIGTVSVIELLQSDPESRLVDVADLEPVRVDATADVVDVTLLMADYNLMTVSVVDADDQILGVITVDDVLEATIPDDWRRREPPTHPEPARPDLEVDGTPSRHSEPQG